MGRVFAVFSKLAPQWDIFRQQYNILFFKSDNCPTNTWGMGALAKPLTVVTNLSGTKIYFSNMGLGLENLLIVVFSFSSGIEKTLYLTKVLKRIFFIV